MKSNSFQIALSGISCAIAVVCLLIGFFVPFSLGFGYIFAMVALMLPLSKDFYVGGALAYIGTCILAISLGAAAKFWDLIPFILFFGLHPLVNALQLKFKINVWIGYAVKAIWFDLTLVASYFIIFHGAFGGSLLPENVLEVLNDFVYLFIAVGGTLFFLLYDRFVFRSQAFVTAIVNRIKK